MNCPICASAAILILFKTKPEDADGRTTSVCRCENCKTGFLHPQIFFKEIEEGFYNQEYHAYQPLNMPAGGFLCRVKRFIKTSCLNYFLGYGRKKFWQAVFYPFFLRMSFYPQYLLGGRALDVGCGVGKYMRYLKEIGWDTYGLDISGLAVETASASGLKNIHKGELRDRLFPAGFFDLVNLHHVFEHLPDPHAALKDINFILKTGGELIITVPNFSSIATKIFQKNWGGLDIPRHLFFLNENSFRILAEKSGFQIKEVFYSDTFRGIASGFSYLFFKNDGRKYEKYFLPAGIFLDLFFDPLLQKLKLGDQLTIKAKKIK